MKAYELTVIIVAKEKRIKEICKSISMQFCPEKLTYKKCEWFAR